MEQIFVIARLRERGSAKGIMDRIAVSLSLMSIILGVTPSSLLAESSEVVVASIKHPPGVLAWKARVVDKLTMKGDDYYDTRDDAGHADEAIRLYKKVLKVDPKSHGAFWRLARSYKWKGDMATSIQERVAAYRAAERYAKKAVALNPEAVNGHLMLGISYGLVGATEGGIKAVRLLPLLKQEMNIVLEKDPKNEIAHLVYGVLYRVLPGFLGGSSSKSIKALKKAIKANPYRTTHYLELAKSYLKKGKKKAAKKSLQELLAIVNPTDFVQARSDRKDANELLEKLG